MMNVFFSPCRTRDFLIFLSALGLQTTNWRTKYFSLANSNRYLFQYSYKRVAIEEKGWKSNYYRSQKNKKDPTLPILLF